MSKPTLHPIGENIVVKRIEAEEKTKGGIFLPDRAKEKPRQGVVVAVGKGKVNDKGKLREPELKKNDRVLFGAYAGTEVKVGGEEFLILRESDILAVMN